ncbi:PREDICTED: protein RRP6-like 3 isoform X2 [Nelumbo nucifera]|uniref:Protein RRP6-like 3 isoform X2 n=1 Tax=Nelumbo nucifera TaxID=4432 RepID=A0A1U8BGS8_NELNU|nr:PREDICTED: protein RRP6-like 3 isoform X2 [Nelumbo nucifera]
MENVEKIKFVFTVACFAAISFFVTTTYRRRRKQKFSANLCYLEKEQKPQNTFKRLLADNSYIPFKHFNRNETHEEMSSNSHPYEQEIRALLEKPPVEFAFVTGEFNLKMSGSHVWVETESQLKELVEVLRNERVFAVDTEQHSLRSFLGFTALVQISTQKEDYLVDTIALYDVMSILRPVFSNPSICKVFHGADNDVLWLQRDFHIYVVNLFDTAKACELLSKPHKSLAYLLETYCGVMTNKMLQREDWRMRPLSEEMVQYARVDAHYLLYIANRLATELKSQVTENSACLDDKFHFVLEASRRSNMVCLQLYVKEIEASPGDSAASSICSRHLNGQGFLSSCETKELVRQLCTWRDLMARVHDESLRYVLSDQAIVALASKVPKTSKEIFDTISEADINMDLLTAGSLVSSPSPIVCSHLEDFHYILQDKLGSPDEVFERTLQKCLGSNGSCPLSIYNYALLSKSNLKSTNGLLVKQKGSKTEKKVGRKSSRELFVQKFSCKSPVYHNCRIYASDGRLLCYCDRRKLEWYLRRDLAKLIDDDPLAIMLLFEPKGRPEDEGNDFYIQSKKNICVGCGEGNHYLRYRIIPSCYRMHFPEHLKSHRSHDIVLLCVDCHEVAHSAAEKYKKQIASEFGIPLYVRKVLDSTQKQAITETSGPMERIEEAGVSPLQLRTAAMALLRHGPRMPAKRREELTLVVMKYFGGREISEEDLERALLVGMSPHERRRLEKKRGLSFKHSKESLLSNETNGPSTGIIGTAALLETLETDVSNGAPSPKESEPNAEGDEILFKEMDACAREGSMYSGIEVDQETSTTGTEDQNFERVNACVLENVGFESVVTETGNSSLKYNPKLSLLGHGPHGKQVVDYLLKEYGEDGIRQFCQRWRQVFVEAINPRFLPAGWDVMHSGRREFGEYSVYNPAKRVLSMA